MHSAHLVFQYLIEQRSHLLLTYANPAMHFFSGRSIRSGIIDTSLKTTDASVFLQRQGSVESAMIILTPKQIPRVFFFLHRAQDVSGACLVISPVENLLYEVMVTGTKTQVQAALTIIEQVLKA